MRTDDVLRVAADMLTFTADDLAHALDVPVGTAGGWLSTATRRGYFDRVRCGKTYLYSLSARAVRRVAKLPVLDPDERCLLLERVTAADLCEYHGTKTIVVSSIVGTLNHGATKRIQDTVICWFCSAVISQAEYTETPF